METIFLAGAAQSAVKLAVLVGLGFYLVFAFVVIKQVNLMADTLELGLEKELRTFAVFHFILAVGTFALAFLLL